MLPKPYYDEDGIVIYHGDCREILPHLPKVDLVLTDPPYGMNLDTDYSGFSGFSGPKSGKCYPRVIGDDVPFDPTPFLTAAKDAVFFGAQYYCHLLPERGGWLVFNKRGDGEPSAIAFGDAELAWTSRKQQSVRQFSKMWHGVARWSSEGSHHPTQKPVGLMTWCLSFFPDAQTILDPFMGSGTTLVAAKQLGRRAIGIELEEKYCEIAVQRLAQKVFDFGAA